jgi:hypothetical protein
MMFPRHSPTIAKLLLQSLKRFALERRHAALAWHAFLFS